MAPDKATAEEFHRDQDKACTRAQSFAASVWDSSSPQDQNDAADSWGAADDSNRALAAAAIPVPESDGSAWIASWP